MKKILISLILASSLMACNKPSSTVANVGANTTKTPEELKVELTKNIPGLTKVDAINKSSVVGIYEVVVGRKIFYVTEDGKYLFFGNLVDIASKKSITEQRVQELSKIDIKQLPLDLAIKSVKGNGKRTLYIFTDPDCPYCQMLEQQVIPKLTDVTIYTFLFPLPMHPNAMSNSKKIWCSKDRSAALTSYMVDKKPLPANMSCDTSAIDKSIKIGTDIVGIDATPTIILSNGQILQGLMQPDQLSAEMDKADGVKVSDINSSAPVIASAPNASATK